MKRGRKKVTSKVDIIDAAMFVAEIVGYNHITREQVALKVNCSEATVSNYFGNMNQLKIAVIRRAIKKENLKIIAQGIVANDRRVQRLDDELKRKALLSL